MPESKFILLFYGVLDSKSSDLPIAMRGIILRFCSGEPKGIEPNSSGAILGHFSTGIMRKRA